MKTFKENYNYNLLVKIRYSNECVTHMPVPSVNNAVHSCWGIALVDSHQFVDCRPVGNKDRKVLKISSHFWVGFWLRGVKP